MLPIDVLAASESPFEPIGSMIARHAQARPDQPALVQGDVVLSYAELDAWMNRIACALQRDGVGLGDVIGVAGWCSVWQATVFLAALRIGVVVAPLPTSVTPAQFAAMTGDAGIKKLFVDDSAEPLLTPAHRAITVALDAQTIASCASLAACPDLSTWSAGPSTSPAAMKTWPAPQPVALTRDAPFNIIYSSGTTGTPKGIVQSHGMRFMHIERGARYGWGPQAVCVVATPLYSNTTLVVFFPALGYGGTVHLMRKFDAAAYVALAERVRATHSMLVPVQYQRIMALPDFDAHDLSSFKFKFCTSAPFHAALKADVLARWPGGLVEFYGMTEGGGTCILDAHDHPDKLHTVGRPSEGHDMRLIDEDGRELRRASTAPAEAADGAGDVVGEAVGEVIGEVVGRSVGMMTGYHGQPEKTREAEWYDAEGRRYIRTGDIGRFDADGFLILVDRRKDMIISGGFNIYPSDLEHELRAHPAVIEASVVGVPSSAWGETPVAVVVLREGGDGEAVREWLNARVGKTQRVAAVVVVDELPRNAIGKVLKRELRERVTSGAAGDSGRAA